MWMVNKTLEVIRNINIYLRSIIKLLRRNYIYTVIINPLNKFQILNSSQYVVTICELWAFTKSWLLLEWAVYIKVRNKSTTNTCYNEWMLIRALLFGINVAGLRSAVRILYGTDCFAVFYFMWQGGGWSKCQAGQDDQGQRCAVMAGC